MLRLRWQWTNYLTHFNYRTYFKLKIELEKEIEPFKICDVKYVITLFDYKLS